MIVLIEQDEKLRQELQQTFENLGARVRSFEDAQTALEGCRARDDFPCRGDLVVVGNPRGITGVEIIKGQYPFLPVFLLTDGPVPVPDAVAVFLKNLDGSKNAPLVFISRFLRNDSF